LTLKMRVYKKELDTPALKEIIRPLSFVVFSVEPV
jgi:hypothetical protein